MIHKGEHEAIIDRELLEAVQRCLAEQVVQRHALQSRSSSILAGLIFDDRGNAMSPSHTNKKGIRYRYYVSQAVLQHRKDEAGSVPRVSGPDVEAAILDAVKQRRARALGQEEIVSSAPAPDCESVLRHLSRVIIRRRGIEIIWQHELDERDSAADEEAKTIPFDPNLPLKKGFVHLPGSGRMDPRTRGTLLQAIARARQWMDQIVSGSVESFEEIATRENLAERYVRRLSVLAFLSPKIISAITEEIAPADLTVTSLTQALPHSWSAQEQMFNMH